MSLVLDIIMVAIVIVHIIIYAKRGIVKSFILFTGNIISVILASKISGPIAKYIFESLFKTKLIQTITEKFMETGVPQTADKIISEGLGGLPDYLQKAIALFGGNPETINDGAVSVGQGAEELSKFIVENTVAPIVTSLIQIVVFIILFALFISLVRIIARTSNIVKKIPVVGQVNGFLGGILGFLSGMLIVIFIMFVIRLILPYTSVDKEMINNTVIFKWLLYNNPIIALMQ